MALNVSFLPDFRDLNSNASRVILSQLNQTLSTALFNVATGGFRPDLISIV